MKSNKLKFLVAAAVATLAISGTANATMTNTQTGDSSLILTLLDNAAGISATFDLGFSKSTFDQTSSFSWDLSSGDYASAFSAFFATATAANTQFAVFAGDTTGATSGAQSLFTTVATTWTNVSNSTLGNMQVSFDNSYIGANNALTGHSAVANGASTATSATGGNAYAGIGLAYGTSGKIATFGGDTTVAVGSNANVWNIVRNGTNNITTATATKLNVAGFNPYFSVGTNGTLNYVAAAPVPEADTWAMMLAGLGLMGFIARRRTKGESA